MPSGAIVTLPFVGAAEIVASVIFNAEAKLPTYRSLVSMCTYSPPPSAVSISIFPAARDNLLDDNFKLFVPVLKLNAGTSFAINAPVAPASVSTFNVLLDCTITSPAVDANLKCPSGCKNIS